MKTYFYFVLFLFLVACNNPSSEESTLPSVQQVQQNIQVGITLPLKNRDLSYNNGGSYGVYEVPTAQKNLKAKIQLSNNLSISSNQLIVKWVSDLDGVLFVGAPNDNFESAIAVSLSKGLHKISFEVYLANSSEIVKKDVITISNIIKLEATSQLGRIMRLNWTKYEGSNFVSYLIYHENTQPIAEINDINTLQYDFPENYNLADPHPYQIVVKTNNSNWVNETLGSNIVTKTTGDFISIPYYVKKMVKDPIRPKLYAICSPKDVDQVADKYGVIIINTDNFSIENHLLTSTRFTDLSISPDGQYMYLTQRHVDVILKVNLDNYSYNGITTHTAGNGFNNIEAGNNNLLYANVYNDNKNFQMINALNGSYTESFNSFYLSEMRYNNSNDNLYFGEGTSGGHIYKLNASNISTGTYLTLPQYPVFPRDVAYPYPNMTISDNGNHIFWDKYQLDTNLNLIRQFNDIWIQACSPSNQYLSDLNKIYDFNSMNTVITYPSFGNYEYYDSDVYFTDEHTIFTNKSYSPNDGTPSYSYIFRIKIN